LSADANSPADLGRGEIIAATHGLSAAQSKLGIARPRSVPGLEMRRSPVSCLVLLSLALAGCLSPRKDDSKFFVLSPLMADDAAPRVTTAASRPLILGVGPVQLPAYLDRQEVVTRVAPNRLDLSPIDRWAQPLDTNFTQVLAQDLSSAVGTQQVTFYPWYRSTHVDYQVRVDVYSFEANANGTVDMTAHWQIFD